MSQFLVMSLRIRFRIDFFQWTCACSEGKTSPSIYLFISPSTYRLQFSSTKSHGLIVLVIECKRRRCLNEKTP